MLGARKLLFREASLVESMIIRDFSSLAGDGCC